MVRHTLPLLVLLGLCLGAPAARAAPPHDVAALLERIVVQGVCVNADEPSVGYGPSCNPYVLPPAEVVEQARANACAAAEETREPLWPLPPPAIASPVQYACGVNLWNVCALSPDGCGALPDALWAGWALVQEVCRDDLQGSEARCAPGLPPV